MIRIEAVFVGQPQTMTDEQGTWQSAIFRTAVSGAIELGRHGLAGDQVADTKNHGSPDQAVSCQPLDHYGFWNEFYGLDSFGPGSVGENWTLRGADEREICVGDIYQVGSARVQVATPRYPCTKQDRKLNLPGFQQQIIANLRTGFYLRVLKPGMVQAGDEWVLEERPCPEVTIYRLNEHIHQSFDPVWAMQLLDVPELSGYWKRILEIFLRRRARKESEQ
jgi:MOSC domain-containing protein YiiM